MSTICQRFSQNAWKKDLCSNCFKSKEEHKSLTNGKKSRTFLSTPATFANADPPKGIMKTRTKKVSKSGKVSFPKELTKVIGYGGEWSDDDASSESEPEPIPSSPTSSDDLSKEIDELEQELMHLTKVNTDYNMINGNLLGDPEANVKRSFAALKLGSAQKDSDGKKQTLKISVTPFGGPVSTNKVNDIKAKFISTSNNEPVLKTVIKTPTFDYRSIESPPKDVEEVKPVAEKSLMDEISETLARNKEMLSSNKDSDTNKIKLEVNKPSAPTTVSSAEGKRSITRHAPIVKDQAKPKISVFPKFSDTDSNQSDTENSVSGYYDVVEAANSYENIPDGYDRSASSNTSENEDTVEIRNQNKSSFFSNHLISEMFSASKDSKNSKSYNFMSQITSDGLIVTKTTSDDALDSTGSSFDYGTSSSDEEMSSMNRSESDSGIGICVSTNDYTETKVDASKTAAGNSNMDYEDVQVQEDSIKLPVVEKSQFSIDKSRELAGEPDGSADPDGSVEAPALPSSPPPSEARASFLHKTTSSEKPTVPAKPTVSIIKAFVKRTPNAAEQQVISQLQQIMTKSPKIDAKHAMETSTKIDPNDPLKGQKKSRAPDPPSPTADEKSPPDYSPSTKRGESEPPVVGSSPTKDEQRKSKTDDQYPYIYTRNPTGSISKSTSPVIREKDKRERATINPKFRSLNTFSSQYKAAQQQKLLQQRPTTPEPAPRNSLSLSHDNLLLDDKNKKTKNKFSIKKFLRMGSNKPTEPIYDKKDGTYGKVGSENGDATPTSKPRLVIIHPIDINQMEVEVVKELGKVNEIVTGKPPAPPLRKGLDLSKPIRPPPPKSAEVRKKQKISTTNAPPPPPNQPKVSEHNVYANLGEIRSAIAPRKPERTASMREREAQLEVARKRLISKHEMAAADDKDRLSLSSTPSTLERDRRSPFECQRIQENEVSPQPEMVKVSSRLELFERSISDQGKSMPLPPPTSKQTMLSDGIKNSIQKMNNTIDSYLKDKMTIDTTTNSETINNVDKKSSSVNTQQIQVPTPKSPNSVSVKVSSAPAVNNSNVRHSEVDLRNPSNSYEPIIVVNPQRSSLPDNHQQHYSGAERSPIMAGNGGYSKSDYGARYQSHQNLANNNNMVRSVSRSYCGSELSDADIYSPYSFYGSEAGTDVAQGDFHDSWNGHQQAKNRPTNRLRMRKGRSVVHKNLEDNYGAVVIANHEVLAQVLDQIQKTTTVPLALRPLANSINLRFEDFSILEGVRGVVAGRRAFHPAVWANQTHVTLALSADCNQMTDLNPITEFCDLVPNHYLPLMPSTELRLVQATICVLPRMLVDTLQSYGQMLKIRSENLKNQAFSGSTLNLAEPQQTILRNGTSVQNLSTFGEPVTDLDSDTNATSVQQMPGMPSYDDLLCREVGFVMLQLVNGLKNLQAKGIEEMPLSMSNVILCKDLENKEVHARLTVLHGLNQDMVREDDEPMGTLCQCAQAALTSMFPSTKLTATLSAILSKDRSESLSKTKSVLEFALWGPSDVALHGSSKEREMALQRWLDLERATILHGLVRSRVDLSAYDECHLMFLVRSSAKYMCEASAILCGSNDIPE